MNLFFIFNVYFFLKTHKYTLFCWMNELQGGVVEEKGKCSSNASPRILFIFELGSLQYSWKHMLF